MLNAEAEAQDGAGSVAYGFHQAKCFQLQDPSLDGAC